VSEERSADVIVVGAGAAGSVVARRLHDAGACVLLLEAGQPPDDERVADASRSFELPHTAYDWAPRTVPQRGLHGRTLEWPQGRALGGSTAINTLVWIRGCPEDYDAWGYPGNPGWSYRDLLPLLRRVEDVEGGGDERGIGGPMPVLREYRRGPVHRAVMDAMLELGVPFNADQNAGDPTGVGWCQYNVRDGRRVSAADAYLAPILGSPRLQVVTSARARRLLLEGERCVGVEWAGPDGGVVRGRAGQQVVVAAGPLGSPKLLLLSGIGPAAELRALGIDARVDLPGVGRNLQDHVHVPLLFGVDREIEPPAGVPWMQTNTFLRTDPGLLTPDIQAPSVGVLGDYPGLSLGDAAHGFTVAATILRTASVGKLRLASADPGAMPLIDPATYDAPGDLDAVLRGVRFLRGLGRSEALRAWGVRELHPGPRIDDDALEDYARRVTKTASHPVGTCKMGVDAAAVVDPRLRVRGVEGLRVADASIMPTVTSGNTHVPSLVIGERAAELMAAG